MTQKRIPKILFFPYTLFFNGKKKLISQNINIQYVIEMKRNIFFSIKLKANNKMVILNEYSTDLLAACYV